MTDFVGGGGAALGCSKETARVCHSGYQRISVWTGLGTRCIDGLRTKVSISHMFREK